MKQIFAALVTLAMSSTSALSSNLENGDMASIELLPGWVQPDGSRMAAIKITLEEGWHTYWRAPGDAGIPPQLTVRSSDNISGIKMHWPTPQVYEQNGMRYVGYE